STDLIEHIADRTYSRQAVRVFVVVLIVPLPGVSGFERVRPSDVSNGGYPIKLLVNGLAVCERREAQEGVIFVTVVLKSYRYVGRQNALGKGIDPARSKSSRETYTQKKPWGYLSIPCGLGQERRPVPVIVCGFRREIADVHALEAQAEVLVALI